MTAPAHHRTDLAVFFTTTFLTTGTFWLIAILLGGPATSPPTAIPYLLGGFGPVIGAIAVRIRRARHHHPIPTHTVRLRLTTRLLWVLPLLVLAPATVVGAALLAHLLGGPAVDLAAGQDLIATIGGPVPFLITMLIGGPLAEEPGWRGTAYPRLRASLNRLQTGLLLGTAWALWHLPLFFISGTIQSQFGLISWSGLLFTVSVFPMALLTGWAYERAGVAAAIAVHFGVNATMALLTVNAPITQAAIVAVQLITVITLHAAHRATPPVSQTMSRPSRAAT
jgi:membrane protease YdiL (CAAX protease family)